MNNYDGKRGIIPEIKTYSLYLSLPDKIMTFAPAGIFTIVAILLLSGVLQNANGEPPKFIGFFFLLGAAWFWYFVSSVPYKIKVYGNVEIEFIGLLRKRRVSPIDIVSIRPYGSQYGFLLVKTSRGKIKILNQFDGFHEFINNLKASNPLIELRGC